MAILWPLEADASHCKPQIAALSVMVVLIIIIIIVIITVIINNNNRYLAPSVGRTVINGGPDVQMELEFRSVGFFVEGRKPENPEKNPQGENQQH